MNTQGALFKVNRAQAKSLEKLSTGLRINTASDDAAGLAVSENLRTQVRGMGQALRNTQDTISLLNIADGALSEQADIMHRMRELIIEAKNDTYTQTERNYMGTEFEALANELDRIAQVTNFNGMRIFGTNDITANDINGSPKEAIISSQVWGNASDAVFGANDVGSSTHFNMMVGANYTENDASSFNNGTALNAFDTDAENLITIQFGMMDATGLMATDPTLPGTFSRALTRNGQVNAFDHDGHILQDQRWGTNVQEKLTSLMNLIDGDIPTLGTGVNIITGGTNHTGLERINIQRAYIGAMTNRLEHNVNNLLNGQVNQQAAESQIRDVDFAHETANFTKNQILSQSATSMLSQANMIPQGVLQLLG